MPGLKVLLTSLTILFVLCAPALAQSVSASAPSEAQYRSETCPRGVVNDQVNASLCQGADASVDNVEHGTDAVNDAMDETTPSASPSAVDEALVSDETSGSSASASVASASAEGNADEDGASTDGNGENEGAGGEGLASITELPETGGAPLVTLALGTALIASGLATRRAVGR